MDNNTAIKCTAAIIRAMGMLAQCSLPETKQSGYTHGLSDFYEIASEIESELCELEKEKGNG